MKQYDRCHVYVASVTDWPSLVPSPYLLHSPLSSVSTFQLVLFTISHLSFPVQLTASPSLPPSLPSTPLAVFSAAERRALHDDAAGRDASWHRRGHEVPVGHELRPQRPRRPEHPGQQQLSLQGVRLWPVALSGRHFR